jgi:hypothetical protein
MADDNWKKERDTRLGRIGVRDPNKSDNPECIHCGRPFDPSKSTGGPYGMCQDCIDD